MMKNMIKKFISLIMVIAISMISFAALAQEAAPVQESSYTQAQLEKYNQRVSFLTSVGIWDFAETDPAGKVTRGEFARLIARLCNLSTEVSQIGITYSDVGADTQFGSDIYAVGAVNLMVGAGGVFSPEAPITYNQAVKAIICALGYEAIANGRGGYPNGYYSVALDLGLTVGRGRDEEITRFDSAKLAEKAANTAVMNTVGYTGDTMHYVIDDNTTMLSLYHGIYKAEGEMTDNGITSLKGRSAAREGSVTIGGKLLRNENAMAEDLLGLYVTYYYRSEDNLLMYAEEKEYANTTLTIEAEDLVKDAPGFSKTAVYYSNEADKTMKAQISPYADYIYNGSAYRGFLVGDLKIKSGTLTLIDNDADKVYDVIKAEEYVNYVMQVNDQANEAFFDSKGNAVRYGEYDFCNIYDDTGAEKLVSRIKDKSVLSVYASKDAARIKVVVSEQKAEGKVISTETMDDGGQKIVLSQLVEGVETELEYEFSHSFTERVTANVSGYEMPVIGNEYTLYLDFNGRIAGIDMFGEREQYAYFISAGSASGIDKRVVQVEAVLNTGELVVLTTAKKIVLNGTKTENPADLLAQSELYVDNDPSKGYQHQLIKIKLNSLGEIKEIKTTKTDLTSDTYYDAYHKAMGFDPTTFCKVYENTSAEYYNAKRSSYSGTYIMDEDSTIFLLPPDDEFAPEYIKVITTVDDLYNQARKANVKMYDADETWTVGAVVVQRAEGQGFLPDGFVVSKSVKSVDSDGDEIYMVTGYYKEQEYTFREARPGQIDKVVPGGLKFGDIVAIAVDADFNIVDVKMRVRTSEAKLISEAVNGGSINTSEYVLYGHVYAKNDKVISLSTDNGATIFAHPIATATKPVVIDYVNKELRVGTFAEIPVSATLSEDGRFTFTDNGVMMYIYRYSGRISDSAIVIK